MGRAWACQACSHHLKKGIGEWEGAARLILMAGHGGLFGVEAGGADYGEALGGEGPASALGSGVLEEGLEICGHSGLLSSSCR